MLHSSSIFFHGLEMLDQIQNSLNFFTYMERCGFLEEFLCLATQNDFLHPLQLLDWMQSI